MFVVIKIMFWAQLRPILARPGCLTRFKMHSEKDPKYIFVQYNKLYYYYYPFGGH